MQISTRRCAGYRCGGPCSGQVQRHLVGAPATGEAAARYDPFDTPELCDGKALREAMTLQIFWLPGDRERVSAP